MHEQWKKYFDQPLGPPLPSRPVDPEREAELDALLAEHWKTPVVVDKPLPTVRGRLR